ncbi:M48 family metallopeptidase [Leptospira sp. GIMC2001]|uniref:M48 family metallopeptidase n=1 Tax=Leptospira sp. GIMC2001 TaxID=1513297 RepID=UPI00234B768F|nr:M48 family metallopeptidase [Leptospira sp. GIMC2001]WCL49908.1 M48 family metallopeptidase [Leptospira sp. GIMC2001]
MSDYISFPCRYFSGSTPIPRVGVVTFEKDSLLFRDDESDIRFQISDFHRIESHADKLNLILFEDERTESPILELQIPAKSHKEIKKIFTSIKKEKSIVHKFKHFFYSLSKLQIASLSIISLIIVSLLFFIIGNYSYKLVPSSADNYLGSNVESLFEKEFTFCDDEQSVQAVERIVRDIRPSNSPFTYKVKIAKSPISNAFALAGGRIYILSGLLNESDSPDELAGVIAHEIAHIEQRHHVRNMIKALGTAFLVSMIIGPGIGDFEVLETATEIGSTLLILKYSRDFEEEADKVGTDFLHDAGYSAHGMLDFFRKVYESESSLFAGIIGDEDKQDNPNETQETNSKIEKDSNSKSSVGSQIIDMLSTHPATEERIAKIQNYLDKERKTSDSKKWKIKNWKKIQNSCKV